MTTRCVASVRVIPSLDLPLTQMVSLQHFYDPTISRLNSYSGGQYQMSTSGLTETNQLCYEYAPGGGRHTGCFSVFAFEYEPGLDGAPASSIVRLTPLR
jgi:hypothetical protein